ncbi:hypothetical protein SDC9_32819 [bioreactor metagenome]|uniref:Uncharacterized protein n=1 Tax=bioreactor metagenome TaxID=1076179 RepID=A0A644V7T2_9ZZZZ
MIGIEIGAGYCWSFFPVYQIFTKEVPHPFIASGKIIFELLKNSFFIYVFLKL